MKPMNYKIYKNMKLNVLKIVMVFSFIGMLLSCSSDEEKHAEFAQIVESRSCESLLNDLYLGCDGDIEALARVLRATPSSIERLRKGETLPTKEFEERVKQASLYYVQNGQDFNEVRAVLDKEYAWYEYVLHFPAKNPTLSIVITIILAIISIFTLGIPIGVLFLFYIVVWIISLFSSPEPIPDNYTDSINVTIEQLK